MSTDKPKPILSEAEGEHQLLDGGFQNVRGTYPTRHNESDVSRETRGFSSVAKKVFRFANRISKAVQGKAQRSRKAISEPSSIRDSKYPYLSTLKTEAGHLIEVDSTPANEAITVRHPKGSSFEILKDGTIKIISTRNHYTAIAGDDDMIIEGACNIVISGNANIRVKGDMNTQIDGDHNVLVKGSQNIEILGDQSINIKGNAYQRVTQSLLRDVRGSITDRCLSNYISWVKGTHTTNIGGDVTFTTEGDYNIVSDKKYTLEAADGSIEIKSTTSFVKTGIIYAQTSHIIDKIYCNDLQASTAIIPSLDGNITGTAQKAVYANTAGAAPTGTPIPTLPSTGSPTAPTAKSDGNSGAVKVVSTSDDYIKALDKSTVNGGYVTYVPDFGLASTMLLNGKLRYDQTFVQWLVDENVITTEFTYETAPNPKAEFSNISDVITGDKILEANTAYKSRAFANRSKNKIKLRTKFSPKYQISEDIELTPETRISDKFMISHFVGADNDDSVFKDQIGLTKIDIAKNMQLVAYNILEPIIDIFCDRNQTFITLVNGLYNLHGNETLEKDSIPYFLAQGLCVGITIPNQSDDVLFSLAVWAANNLVYDRITLSYWSCEPEETYSDNPQANEPTLFISIVNGTNKKEFETRFNGEKISSSLQDLGREKE